MWLSSHNFASKHNDILSRRHGQTGAWFLNSPEFRTWVTQPNRTLFCPGNPGTGKSVLASISVEHLKTRFKDQDFAVVYVFCNHAEHRRNIDLVASILEQLLQRTGVADELRILHRRDQSRRIPPKVEEISDILQTTIRKFNRVFIVIDALDECSDSTRKDFISEIHKLRSIASLLITSRQVESIESELPDAIHLKIQALDADLEEYVRFRTEQDSTLRLYMEQDPSLREEAIKTVIGSARGM